MIATQLKAVFYLLPDDLIKTRDLFLCRLIEKAFTSGRKIYVNAATLEEAQTIDTQLWTFRDVSFVPHAIYNTDLDSSAPVLIGNNAMLSSDFDVLINLAPEIPEFYSKFQHIIELIISDDMQKKIGREHYKFYQQNNYQLETHTV